MAKAKFFLIDAHALCYRAYFAVQNLRTSWGQPTNAIFGFTNTLKKILSDFKPDYVAVCFDAGKKTHRQAKFADYKIHRPSMPDDLISQIPLIKELVLAHNIPIFELEGFEADDLIATIAKKIDPKDADVVIVSGDKDMIQLIQEHIKMFDYRKQQILDAKAIKAHYGFEPNQIVDFIALAGDATDNIPGVKGIGKVTATQLIQTYGTLDEILKNDRHLTPSRIGEKIQEQKEQALMSRDLALLDFNVPISFDLKMSRLIAPNVSQLRKFFEKLELRKFADELGSMPEAIIAINKTVIKTQSDIQHLCQKIQKKKRFAFALSEDSQAEDFLSFQEIAIAIESSEVFVVPSKWIKDLQGVFADCSIMKICHDLKSTLKVFDEKKYAVAGKIFDVMLAGYLLEVSQSVRDISMLAWKYLKRSIPEQEHLIQKVACIFDLSDPMDQELHSKSLIKLFEDIEVPLAHVLFQMERQGVCLDTQFLNKLSQEADREINCLAKKLFGLAKEEFNLNSPKQLARILFEKLKLPAIKKTKTGYSTDEGVLQKLAFKHEFPKLLLDYRQLTKLSSTYIKALPKLVNSQTKKIHAVFDQAGTETGRLSSRNPNLQNIPIRTDLGRQIRKAFIAQDNDHVIVSADYSQIELRILAHLSQDQSLIKTFHENQDIHNFTAALIFDLKEEEVTTEMRYAAKRINFGIVYGMSAFGLAKDLGVSQKEAQDFIDRYFLRYPNVQAYMNNEIQKAEKNGYVLTLLNRRRDIPEIHSENISVRQFAQRQAINTPVQGSAADLIKMAMIQVQKSIDEEQLESRMTITVHDELVFDVVKKEQDQAIHLIRREMENPLHLSVPIKVSIKVGKNWLETSEVHA